MCVSMCVYVCVCVCVCVCEGERERECVSACVCCVCLHNHYEMNTSLHTMPANLRYFTQVSTPAQSRCVTSTGVCQVCTVDEDGIHQRFIPVHGIHLQICILVHNTGMCNTPGVLVRFGVTKGADQRTKVVKGPCPCLWSPSSPGLLPYCWTCNKYQLAT